MYDEHDLEWADFFLGGAGVPNTVPEPRVCKTRRELGDWFYQFARAARAARLGDKG